jgi:hypothetical protein
MKSFVLVLLGITSTLVVGCSDNSQAAGQSATLYRSQFAGMATLKATEATKLKEIWALPPAEDVRNQALSALARTPFKLWQKSFPAGAADRPELIRPLLDDLLSVQSYIEVNGANMKFDSVIAVELDDQRAKLWETNLGEAIAAWKLAKPRPLSNKAKGWEITGGAPHIQLRRIGKWLLVGWSLEKLSRIDTLAEAITKTGRPVPQLKDGGFLSLFADIPSLGRWIDVLRPVKLREVELTIYPRGEYIRSEARLALTTPLNWKFEPWQIPTNLVRDPLISFSVAQGIEPLLKDLPGFQQLGLKSTPSQFCAWSLDKMPFGSYWSFPVPNSSNALRQVAPNAKTFIKHYIADPVGDITYISNKSHVVWTGLPLAIPSVQSVSDTSGDYVVAGLLPMMKRTNPPPAELMAQLKNRPDLIYYDWELTSEKLPYAGLSYELLDVVSRRTLPGTNAPSVRLKDQAAPLLGNAITEVTVTSPAELKLVRKSHLGVTGFEFATLLRWIDSPAFPLGYEPPSPLRRKPTRPQTPSPP